MMIFDNWEEKYWTPKGECVSLFSIIFPKNNFSPVKNPLFTNSVNKTLKNYIKKTYKNYF